MQYRGFSARDGEEEEEEEEEDFDAEGEVQLKMWYSFVFFAFDSTLRHSNLGAFSASAKRKNTSSAAGEEEEEEEEARSGKTRALGAAMSPSSTVSPSFIFFTNTNFGTVTLKW